MIKKNSTKNHLINPNYEIEKPKPKYNWRVGRDKPQEA